ncbi:MAG: heme exporter protein CcmD [Planktomarina sp.]
MMPDLGKYAAEVTAAYGVSLTLLATLIAVYVIRNARVRRALKKAEERSDA